jgi:hypothetical protein
MFTAHEYRTKAAEYGRLLEMARSPSEASEYRDLHQNYSVLADNLDWLATNAGKVVVSNQSHAPSAESRDTQARQVEEERILRCLGLAAVLNWNRMPVKLQHSLIEDASSIQRGRGAPMKGALHQFLHDHAGDARRQQQNGSNAGAERVEASGGLPVS